MFDSARKREARRIARSVVAELEEHTPDDIWSSFSTPSSRMEQGDDGRTYHVEIQAMWDADPNGDIRVVVSVDSGGWSSLAPASEGFIVANTHDIDAT
jgi:hypothetical protein